MVKPFSIDRSIDRLSNHMVHLYQKITNEINVNGYGQTIFDRSIDRSIDRSNNIITQYNSTNKYNSVVLAVIVHSLRFLSSKLILQVILQMAACSKHHSIVDHSIDRQSIVGTHERWCLWLRKDSAHEILGSLRQVAKRANAIDTILTPLSHL